MCENKQTKGHWSPAVFYDLELHPVCLNFLLANIQRRTEEAPQSHNWNLFVFEIILHMEYYVWTFLTSTNGCFSSNIFNENISILKYYQYRATAVHAGYV